MQKEDRDTKLSKNTTIEIYPCNKSELIKLNHEHLEGTIYCFDNNLIGHHIQGTRDNVLNNDGFE